MTAMASQITGVTIVYSTVCSGHIKEDIKKMFRVTGPCEANSPMTGEIPAHRASNAENVCIWWRHHVYVFSYSYASLIVLYLSDELSSFHRISAICFIYDMTQDLGWDWISTSYLRCWSHYKFLTALTVTDNVTHECVVVLSVKSSRHYIYRFKLLSAIILTFTKIAFLGN